MDWNEWEELAPTGDTIQQVANVYRGASKGVIAAEVTAQARGAVRTYQPISKPFIETGKIFAKPDSLYYEVNLGFEVEIPHPARMTGTRFAFIMFSARLWAATEGKKQPRVYDLFPRDLFEGAPRMVKVEFGPEIKATDIGGTF